MNDIGKLLELVKKLSLKDEKTLVGKALKTCEEAGELAKAVIPYSGLPQSSHKMTSRADIIQECSDIILCALSVSYNLNATNEEIFASLQEKAAYWETLQNREASLNLSKLPFEIHVTVHPTTDKEQFVSACQSIGVKATILRLYDQNLNNIGSDLMTSSEITGSNADAIREMERISYGLSAFGFRVVREKIETIFFHPSAPSKGFKDIKTPKEGYFEAHIDISTEGLDKEGKFISDIAKGYVLFPSINEKRADQERISLTLRRSNTSAENFKDLLDKIQDQLTNRHGLKIIEKPLVEFAMYDTNKDHDKEWSDAA